MEFRYELRRRFRRRHLAFNDCLVIHLVPVELAVLAVIFAHNRSVERHSYKCASCPRISQNLSVNAISVSAAAVLPTGPAAADASAPIVNLSLASFSMP
jgi:hypothetical protein